MTWSVDIGNCLDLMRQMPDACVDAVVTDPPAGISFMAKDWDHDKGGRDRWIAWLEEIMREVLRVLKPGAHAFVWALPRTSHWTATALENAGFEVREIVTHLFGSGFPKSRSISKDLDAKAGAKREVVGTYRVTGNALTSTKDKGGTYGVAVPNSPGGNLEITVPTTELAKCYDGFGTALKPASEHWILCRKPIEGTLVNNVTKWGTGGINVDGCRIPSGTEHFRVGVVGRRQSVAGDERSDTTAGRFAATAKFEATNSPLGRWPANVVLSHADGCVYIGAQEIVSNAHYPALRGPGSAISGPSGHIGQTGLVERRGNETIEKWECVEGCPVKQLDEQSGVTTSGAMKREVAGYESESTALKFSGRSGASRFFNTFLYQAKPSTKEREAGCEALPKKSAGALVDRDEGSAGINNPRAGAGRTSEGRANTHPTVKSITLMRWLVRLVTPPGGLVLDPFAGSGSTGVACIQEGFDFVGFEQEAEYARIAYARMTHHEK